MVKLSDWIREQGMTHAEFARQLRVTRAAVNAWCRGVYFPSAWSLSRIEELTDGEVTAKSFCEGEQRDV